MRSLAIVVHKLSATGVVRNALTIARHMQQAGWQVTLFSVRPGGDLVGMAEGLDWRVLGRARLGRSLEMAFAVKPLRSALARLSPDVVLSAGNHAHFAVLSAVAGMDRRERPATVCRISNDLAHDAGLRISGILLKIRRQKTRYIAREASRLVLVSPHLADDPVMSEALSAGRARLIPNGVDRERVRLLAQQPCPHPWANEDIPIVLAVGRLTAQKNFATLVSAFAQVRSQRPVRLIIVGGGKRSRRARLERQAKALGVGDHVAFVGRTDNPFPYFNAAAVFALPSLWEGAPNVLLEALACGLPVVASSLAGSAPETLDHGRYGRLVEPRDVDAIARALLAQLDPDHVIRPGDRVAAYSSSRAMAQYQAVFEELVGTDCQEDSCSDAVRSSPTDRSERSQSRYR